MNTGKNNNFSIVIVTFDQRFEQYFVPLLKEIKKQRKDIEVLVQVNGPYLEKYDQAYRKNILNFCAEYANVYPQTYTRFTSLSKMWNTGIQNSSNNNVLVLGDDILIKEGFFDWIERQAQQTPCNECATINRIFAHFMINRDMLADINWFEERLLGIGWEDFDIVRHKQEFKNWDTNKIVSMHNLNLEEPSQKKILGHLKYTEFNRVFYEQKWKSKTAKPERQQYPYYKWTQENYSKMEKK